MRAPCVLFAVAALALAGCVNVYESGSEPPVECERTFNQSRLDEGVPNPLLCERVGDGTNETSNAT